MKLNRDDGIASTVEEEQLHLEVAFKKFQHSDFCYTWVTVKSLLDKIQELKTQLEAN